LRQVKYGEEGVDYDAEDRNEWPQPDGLNSHPHGRTAPLRGGIPAVEK
jgi:hypothetical protein